MSSGSMGVMNVWLSRVNNSWMTSSPRFQHVDFGGKPPGARCRPGRLPAGARSFEMISTCCRKVVKLLLAWQQSHNWADMERTYVIGLEAVGQRGAITIGNNREQFSVVFPIRRFRRPDQERVSNKRLVSTFPMAESMSP